MSVDQALRAYCHAFAARDTDGLVALFDRGAVYELPFLGQRLVGHGEIRAGLARVFSLMETCSIEVSDLKSQSDTAIAEGRLNAKLHRDRQPIAAPLAMVMTISGEKISRLSTYLDARPFRLWSDGPIFATAC
jgi:ketosteroid isomerase-like protein